MTRTGSTHPFGNALLGSLVFHGLVLVAVGLALPSAPLSPRAAGETIEVRLAAATGTVMPPREALPVPVPRRAPNKPQKPRPLPAEAPSVASAGTAANAGGREEAVPPLFGAEYLHNPAPPYPPLAKRMGQEGEVRLKVRVSASGAAAEVRLAQSSGHELLDEAALGTVVRWRFIPASLGGRAVEAWVLVPVRFRLADKADAF